MPRKDRRKSSKRKKPKRKKLPEAELLETIAVQDMAMKVMQTRFMALVKDNEQMKLERDVAMEGAAMQHGEMISRDALLEELLAQVDSILDRAEKAIDRLLPADVPQDPAHGDGQAGG